MGNDKGFSPVSLPTSSAVLMKGISCRPPPSGQGPASYQPRATPWVRVRLDSVAGQRPASSPNESHFQRWEWSLADQPRALPWAAMTDAIGVSNWPVPTKQFCRASRRTTDVTWGKLWVMTRLQPGEKAPEREVAVSTVFQGEEQTTKPRIL